MINKELKEEFKERLQYILKENNLKNNIEILLYSDKHFSCPLGFDLELINNKIIFSISLYEEEEPPLFWECVEEEVLKLK